MSILWAWRGSNPRPSDYESPALTTELQAQKYYNPIRTICRVGTGIVVVPVGGLKISGGSKGGAIVVAGGGSVDGAVDGGSNISGGSVTGGTVVVVGAAVVVVVVVVVVSGGTVVVVVVVVGGIVVVVVVVVVATGAVVVVMRVGGTSSTIVVTVVVDVSGIDVVGAGTRLTGGSNAAILNWVEVVVVEVVEAGSVSAEVSTTSINFGGIVGTRAEPCGCWLPPTHDLTAKNMTTATTRSLR